MKYAVLLAVLLLGCSKQETLQVAPSREIPFEMYYVDGYPIHEFHLTDGTHCAARLHTSSITCDWKKENVE